jgi:hypothetical protein
MPVAVANAGGGQAHAHFAGLGWQDVDIFDLEGTSGLVEDGGFHGQLLVGVEMRYGQYRAGRLRAKAEFDSPCRYDYRLAANDF